jgi:hypothetical protein
VSWLNKVSYSLFPIENTCQFPCQVCESLKKGTTYAIDDYEDHLGLCPNNNDASKFHPNNIIKLLQQGVRIRNLEDTEKALRIIQENRFTIKKR